MKRLILLFLIAVAAFGQASGVGQIWSVIAGTLQSGATANGNGTALAVSGLSTASLTVNCSVACAGGTTVNFEGTEDGTNFVALSALQLGSSVVATGVTNQGTTPTVWSLSVSGLQSIRARISGYSAGTVSVTGHATATPFSLGAISSAGNGTTDAGTTRVSISSDSTGQVKSTNFPGTVDTNNGNKGASTLRAILATDSVALPAWGHGATGSAAPGGATMTGVISSGNMAALIGCDQSAFLDMTTATTTQIVALSSGKVIHVCEVAVEAGGTSTVTMKYGTGTNCGTGTTAISPGWELTAQNGIAEGSGLGQIYATAASNALCFTNSAAVNTHIHVSYTSY